MAQLDNGYGLPPEYQPQMQDISRQFKIADMLRQQSQDPLQGQMVSGHYVAPSWTQQLSKALSGYAANKKEEAANAAQNKVYQDYRGNLNIQAQKLADALKTKQVPDGYNTTLPERQFDQFGSPIQGQDMTPVQGEQKFKDVQPSQQDISTAMLNYYTGIGQPELGAQYLGKQAELQQQQGFKTQELQAQHEFLQQQAQQQRDYLGAQADENRKQRMQELQMKIEDGRTSRQEREDMQREMAHLTASLRTPPQPQAPVSIMGPNGKPMFVPPSEAYGKQPYNVAQETKDSLKAQQNEQARISAQQVLDQAQILFQHPGRSMGTGATSFMSSVPGTDAKGFQANLDTFKAQTFVPMVSALKGMGALSDAEGKKLSDSVGALDPRMPEKEFENSLKAVTKTLYDKAKANGLNVSLPEFAAPAPAKTSPRHPVLDAADAIIGGGK